MGHTAAPPYLEKSNMSAIVYPTSVAIREPLDRLVLSNTVRLSIAGLARSLARELGRKGIRVNMVLPGLTKTERLLETARDRAQKQGKSVEEALKEMTREMPLDRPAEPDEIATTTVAGMSAGTYIAIEAAKEGAEIGLITAGIIGAATGAVAGFLRKFNNFF